MTLCKSIYPKETSMNGPKAWETYEQVAAYLLNQFASEFGLQKVEGKQKVSGKMSGTEWEIDAKGVGHSGEVFLIVECRRSTTSRQSQEKVGGLAYRIFDTGAKGGIMVSPLGLHEGASKIARAANIYSVVLNKDSTTSEYVLEFLNKLRVGKLLEAKVTGTGSMSATIIHADGTIDELGEL
jgi:hypothetical protein